MELESYLVKYALTYVQANEEVIKRFYSKEALMKYINRYNITNDMILDLKKIENLRLFDLVD